MRVLFDTTFSVASGKQSGIERVVRSLLNAALQQEESASEKPGERIPDVEVVPVFIHQGAIFELGEVACHLFESVARYQSDCLKDAPRGYQLLAKWICKASGSRKVYRWLLPSSGHLGVFKSRYKRQLSNAFTDAAKGSQRIEVKPSDILWLPDAYWATADIGSAIRVAKESGAYVACLVYDLIPLEDNVTGEIDASRNRNFAGYLESVVTQADAILTISKTVRVQLEDFIAAHWPNKTVTRNISAIPLGAEIRLQTGKIREELSNFFENSGGIHPYLCLGTFEPRKNQEYVLDAFERLWPSHPDLRLCFVGRVGWKCEGILERLRTHSELGRRLLVCFNASDAEVRYCYQQCRAFVTASRSEGFGLPIVEAQWHSKPVLASNIPVHCEVGGGGCTYFELGSPSGLSDAVMDLERQLRSGDRGEPRPAMKRTTWAESWSACQSKLIEGFEKRN